jgi:pyruvate-formate lyase-activating enzyme
MPDFSVLEPVIDPANKITFLLDWELTMKCNLDCSYCLSGLHGGHDNSTAHPPLDQCLQTIDFMFEYVDLYMRHKPKGLKYVVLNVYGGESLHHPNVVEILEQVHQRYRSYQDRWHLTVTTTTNAIVSDRKLDLVIPLIDEFTASYHTESTDRQKQQFRDNLLKIKQADKRLKTVVLMHTQPDKFADAQKMITWLDENEIQVLPRQLDDTTTDTLNYNTQQVKWFDNLYKSKSSDKQNNIIKIESQPTNLSDVGRACCGGRSMCENSDRKNQKFYILDNKFSGWSCSVNWFFLYIKQVNGEVFVNRDCKMRFDGTVGPIGILSESKKILEDLKSNLENKSLPVITCAKHKCHCGLCAPKAQTPELFNQMFSKYTKDYYQ